MLSCSLITGWRDWPKVLHPYNINPMTVASRIISRVHLNRKNYSHIHPQLPSLQLKEFKSHAANISIKQAGSTCHWSHFLITPGRNALLWAIQAHELHIWVAVLLLLHSSCPGWCLHVLTQLPFLFSAVPWWVIWDRCVRNCQDSFLTDHGSLLSQARVSWNVACLQSLLLLFPLPPHTHNSQDEWFLRHNNGLCYYWS